ncbi:sirohydrochlorin chelatase [Cyanobacterium sp. Dongsha4]|uniref:sirohydrochlorin chelatase n=1 Tax=Cyanobacterium sp. DS4 TaxID=2878255 RepID=UPI002E8113BE|nr:sirohydrochlorin chelatase [Cyanobacterium sp. Dongsha4]WVK99157.1 sirohydrochlorin chelatase [Cyanobacterium sp. Dongsha4]
MINSSAYLLVVHGSRNSFYAQQLRDLAFLVRKKLDLLQVTYDLDVAYLELGSQSLSEKIIEFGNQLERKGYKSLKVLPLFLLSGTHVINDIPSEVEVSRQKCSLQIEILPHLGKSLSLISLLCAEFERRGNLDHHKDSGIERILFCHGTSLQKGNEEIEGLAGEINAQVAYWSIKPNLNSVIAQLALNDPQQIMIMPYFLFTGKIIDAIASEVEKLQKKVSCELKLLPPLTQIDGFSDIIINRLLAEVEQ